MNRLERKDRLIRLALLVVAFSAVSILVVITVFMFGQGTPVMFKYGLGKFLAGSNWYPSEKSFGLWPMIVGSLYVTLGAHGHRRALRPGLRHRPDRVLVAARPPRPQAGHRAPGRDSLGRLRLHRRRHPRPVHPGDLRRPRPFGPGRLDHPRHHDPADDHQHLRRFDRRPCRRPTGKGRWPWGRPAGRPSAWSSSRPPGPASSPASSWAWAGPSARPWPSSWSPATP